MAFPGNPARPIQRQTRPSEHETANGHGEWFQVPISLTLAIQTTQTMQDEHEARHGYDLPYGKKQPRIAGVEVKHLLFDPFTFPGSHMLDVAFVGR
jgi:hypothetical protein